MIDSSPDSLYRLFTAFLLAVLLSGYSTLYVLLPVYCLSYCGFICPLLIWRFFSPGVFPGRRGRKTRGRLPDSGPFFLYSGMPPCSSQYFSKASQ